MDEVELERVGHSCADQGSENFCAMLRREYRDWYGNGTGGGLAPCCECQFCGVCALHPDQLGRAAGGQEGTIVNRTA